MATSQLGRLRNAVQADPLSAHRAESLVPRRKAHTKSRNGCIPCKRRKIKCLEEKPRCSNCSNRSTSCEYAPVIYSGRATRQPPVNVFVTNLSIADFTSPSPGFKFSLREMRYFHHFLTAVPHPLPLGNREVWATDVPQIAHRHEYLMNAMISLGAAELYAETADSRMETDILKHRGKAIAGLQKAMNDSSSWSAAGHPDAILATCYILVSQSSRMRDATDDFNIAVRGCALVTEKLRRENIKTAFQLIPEELYEKVRIALKHADHRLAMLPSPEPALRTLIDLEVHILNSRAKPFADALARTMLKFSHSPIDGYIESLNNFGGWYHLALGVIDSLRNPEEAAFVMILEILLLANMVWLKLLIPLMIWPRPRRKSADNRVPAKALVDIAHWIEATARYLPYEYQRFLEFPCRVVEAIPWATLQIQRPSEAESAESVAAKLEILRNIDTQAHSMLGWILRLASELASWFTGYVVANTSERKALSTKKPDFASIPVPLGQLDSAFADPPYTRDREASPDLDPSVLDADEFPFLLFSRLG